jgi:NADH-quinone oxidoreductase subunit C
MSEALPTPAPPGNPGTGSSPPAVAAAPPPPPDAVTAFASRKIHALYPEAIEDEALGGRHPWIRIRPSRLVDVCTFLRDDPELLYDCCHLISGVDWPPKTPADGAGTQEVVYHLVSYARRPDPAYRSASPKNDGFLALKVRVPRDKPEVPSVMSVWIGADWHERETWDLVGIRFTGRGPVRRILLPEDWPGHPLRKDWEYPAEYHGIPIIPPEGR